MIRAALSFAAIWLAGAVSAEQFFEVDSFDVTGVLPDGFGTGAASMNFEGTVYDSLDGQAQLVVSGSLDMFDGVANSRELARQGLIFNRATITFKFSDAGAFAYSGLRETGEAYYLYSRFGQTCEGVPVIGTFVLAYAPDAEPIYGPMIEQLIAGLHIGACG